ncbi:MAG: hypothetical protein K2W33_14900 [Burkholderiales bacterium]|nr:hypothetical protein [Burkholderiales bacterium]
MNALGAHSYFENWPEYLKNGAVGWLQLPEMAGKGGFLDFSGRFYK